MKTAPKSAAKLPQGRVMYASIFADGSIHSCVPDKENGWTSPVLVLPMPTLAAAKKRLRWERMTEEEKKRALRKAFSKDVNQWLCDSLTPDRGYSMPIDNILSLIQP